VGEYAAICRGNDRLKSQPQGGQRSIETGIGRSSIAYCEDAAADFLGVLAFGARQAASVCSAFDGTCQALLGDRLDQVLKRAVLDGQHRRLNVRIPGHQQHRNIHVALAYGAQ
jgi:hypothetical protein